MPVFPVVDPEWISSFIGITGCYERTEAYYIQGAVARGMNLEDASGYFYDQSSTAPPADFEWFAALSPGVTVPASSAASQTPTGATLTVSNAKVGIRVYTSKKHSSKTGAGRLLGWKVAGSRTGDTSGGLSSDNYCRIDFDSGGGWNVSMQAARSSPFHPGLWLQLTPHLYLVLSSPFPRAPPVVFRRFQ
jgi:hypothetical protein